MESLELYTVYNIEDQPWSALKPGTIVKGVSAKHPLTNKIMSDDDIILITESKGMWENNDDIVGVSIKDGEYYISDHSIYEYEIIAFPR